MLTDEDGGVTERTTWGPWGERIEGGERSRVGYTGHQRDAESGLHYSVHRYLDSRDGRWTKRDPAGRVDGQNLYRYVRSNPIKRVDPEGLMVLIFDDEAKRAAIQASLERIMNVRLKARVVVNPNAPEYIIDDTATLSGPQSPGIGTARDWFRRMSEPRNKEIIILTHSDAALSGGGGFTPPIARIFPRLATSPTETFGQYCVHPDDQEKFGKVQKFNIDNMLIHEFFGHGRRWFFGSVNMRNISKEHGELIGEVNPIREALGLPRRDPNDKD